MISSLNPIPTLPNPLGPHKVGTVEWEVPVSEIPSSSPLPDAQISTIKFRIFYPTASTAKSKSSASWLPTPQREWNRAYASFLGAGPRLSSLISSMPSPINFATIPAVPDAPLLRRESATKFPLVVFSHGLGGNFNTYSAVCASLASFGIVCVAPEHRDRSAPVSLIRSADGQTTSIHYQRHPHAPTTKVLNSRNAQLRIRLWELEQLWTVLSILNAGETFSNYLAHENKSKSAPCLKNSLDLQPGRVTWAGHSFGACTIVQFVKSIYYHHSLPSLKGTKYENDLDWRPLYKPASNSELVNQITPDSPLALLDLWAMPLRSEVTKWLWEMPLPCYDRNPDQDSPTNVVSIISAEFYKHPELLNRMKAALSRNPAEAISTLERKNSTASEHFDQFSRTQVLSTPGNKSPSETGSNSDDGRLSDVDSDSVLDASSTSASSPASSLPSRTSSPSPSTNSSVTSASIDESTHASPSSSTTSITPSVSPPNSSSSPSGPKLYLVPGSAHLSQSDFGLLFPRLTRYLMNAESPEETIALNVRAVLGVMRNVGLEVARHRYKHDQEEEDEDEILTDRCKEERFVRVELA